MKTILFFLLLLSSNSYGQQNININFANDSKIETYHLSLLIYFPDGQIQTRVSDLIPSQIKTYSFPVGTEIFVANLEQETYAMKGNDIKATGAKPFIILQDSDSDKVITSSNLNRQ